MSSRLLELALTQLWQVTLLAVIVGATVRLIARNRPHLAHVLWLVVLAKCLTPPLWSSEFGLFSWVETQWSARPEAPRDVHDAPSVQAMTPPPTADRVPASEDAPSAAATQSPPETSDDLPAASSTRPVDIPSRATFSLEWPDGVLIAWATGACGVYLVMLRRWRRCTRMIRRESRPASEEIADQAVALAKRLRMRWAPRVRIVPDARTAPAVVGFVRPTILLPESIAEEVAPDQLAPILAHELLHARRRDAWTGLLQVLALGAWWFHPLIWRVGRRLVESADRCCDEAVVAELGCSASHYAGCLLDVIERRSEGPVLSFPPVPGMGDARDLTERLERIMKLRNGCRKRTPPWCWALLLVLAAITLPGAALVLNADEEARKLETKREWDDAPIGPYAWAAKSTLSFPSAVDRSPRTVRQFDVDDLIESIEGHLNQLDPALKTSLLSGDSNTFRREDAEDVLLQQAARLYRCAGELQPPAGGPRDEHSERRINAWWEEGRLCVCETEEGVAVIERILGFLREDEAITINVGIRFLESPSLELEKALDAKRWFALPLPNSRRDWRRRHAEASGPRYVTSEYDAAHVMLLTENELERFFRGVPADRRTNVMQAPLLRLLDSSRREVIANSNETPFVVDVVPARNGEETKYDPVIEVVGEGTGLAFHATAMPDDAVRLELLLRVTKIVDVEVLPLLGAAPLQDPGSVEGRLEADAGYGVHVQRPAVRTLELETAMEIRPGQTVLLRIPNGPDDDPLVRLVLIDTEVSRDRPSEHIAEIVQTTPMLSDRRGVLPLKTPTQYSAGE